MKKLALAAFIFLLHSPTHAMDLCDSAGGDFDMFQKIEDVLQSPRIKVEYTLSQDCQYTVKTIAEIGSSKSLPDFMTELSSKAANVNSANDSLQSYEMKKINDNEWEQTVKASKSGVSATIVNACKYTVNTATKIVLSCGLKGSNQFIEKNTTSISCENGSAGIKKCVFETLGKAKPYKKMGITIKNACDLAAGGAAETVNGVTRLAQYISSGKIDEAKWVKPGAQFYQSAKEMQDRKPSSFKMDIFR